MRDKKKQPLEIVALARGPSPIDLLLNKVAFKCTICKAPMGTCDCWTKCACGWSFRKGKKCRNPDHKAAPHV